VLLAARRRERLEALAAELPGSTCIRLDVQDPDAVQAALGDERLDLVVNNAGLARGVDPVQTGDPREWSEVLRTNVEGALQVLRATLPGMIERGSGDQVFLGSVAGRQVYPGGTVYCASKFALRAVYEGARLDARGTGVRFCTVDPGMVESEFSLVRFHGDEERARAVYADKLPLQPQDVADAVLYAVTRPPHVNVGELVLWSSHQASTTLFTPRES